jgi:anti-repressor protein
MNAILPFNFGDQPVRVEDRDGQPWFVLADVCRVLGLSNPSMSAQRLDDDEKDALSITDPIGRDQTATIINESGLWSLVLTSRRAEAKAFKRWVTAEVLPTLRRTGRYGAEPMVLPRDPRTLLAYITQQAGDMVALQDSAAAMAPKADAFDRLTDTGGALGIRDAAKALKIGQQVLVDWLIHHGWAFRSSGDGRLRGYRPKEISGHVTHRPSKRTGTDGVEKVILTLQVTSKGLAAIAADLGPRTV